MPSPAPHVPRVEAALVAAAAAGTAIVWVTHDNSQPGRVGGQQLELPSGAISSVARVAGGAEETAKGAAGGEDAG